MPAGFLVACDRLAPSPGGTGKPRPMDCKMKLAGRSVAGLPANERWCFDIFCFLSQRRCLNKEQRSCVASYLCARTRLLVFKIGCDDDDASCSSLSAPEPLSAPEQLHIQPPTALSGKICYSADQAAFLVATDTGTLNYWEVGYGFFARDPHQSVVGSR